MMVGMDIAILGTGPVARTLGDAFAALGHVVVLGSRNPQGAVARPGWDSPLPVARHEQAVVGVDVVVNALPGAVALETLAPLDLEGLVVLDVCNPLDSSAGFPPTLSVHNTDSLAEQIQRAHPGAKVVKTLNTVTHQVMVAPQRVGDGDTTVFVAGDDAAARSLARGLLVELGWTDIVEFEALEAARGLEMWLPLWIRMMMRFGTADFNLKIVR